MVHVAIRVKGRVQGVYFRATTREVATTLGLTGFVRNESDGNVYIEAEGPEEKINDLIRWCRQGPPRADVTDVEVVPGVPIGFTSFVISR